MSQPVLASNLFPVTDAWAYCDHASVGPLPRPTRDALMEIYGAQMQLGKNGTTPAEARRQEVRSQVAAAINAHPDEIAFMRAASDGALLVANGLDWRAGDEIIFPDDEFGANAYPWLNLRARGVRTVLLRAPAQRMTPQLLERLATDRTRLVTVSYVGFSDGYRNDLAAIGRWCRERGVLFAVDAMQGFGHLPFDVRACNADFAYFGTSKWLLSPQGVSVVYVKRELIERLQPALCSWRSVADPMDFLNWDQPLKVSAERFDGGSGTFPAAVAFGVSLKLLTDAGFDAIERHVLTLTERLVEGAKRAGIAVKSDLARSVRSGIVVLDRGQRDVAELTARADAAHVGITVRANGVRVSPHGYNTEQDIDRVLELLAS